MLGNQQGTLLNNSAVFSWQTTRPIHEPSCLHAASRGSVGSGPGSERDRGGAADRSRPKSVSPTSGADAGDAVTYTITFARQLGLQTDRLRRGADRPPAFRIGIVCDHRCHRFGGPIFWVCGSFEIRLAGNVLQLSPGGATVDMAPGRLVTVTVQGNVISTINPNQTVTNTARAAWTSLDGDLPLIERTGADGPGPDASVLNNYVSQGTVSFNAQNVAIAKAIVSTSEASTAANNLLTIGEIVRYSVTLTVPEGQTLNLQIQDLLPTGLTFLERRNRDLPDERPGKPDVSRNSARFRDCFRYQVCCRPLSTTDTSAPVIR